MKRYGKYKGREIVLLCSTGCAWNKCTFCDYCTDNVSNVMKCHRINESVINQITGEFGVVEIVDSGSFFELELPTFLQLVRKLKDTGVKEIRIETHDMYKKSFDNMNQMMNENKIRVSYRCGIETFDEDIRENLLKKGYGHNIDANTLSQTYSFINILVGFEGDNIERIKKDIRIACDCDFQGITINVFDSNGRMKRDEHVVEEFYQLVKEMKLEQNKRFEILDGTRDKNAFDGIGFTNKYCDF